MKPCRAFFFVLSSFVLSAAQASDVSWVFRPGYYTHSPVTGERVAQYEPERPSIVPTDPTYEESGYRHTVIQSGNDRLNLVQTWGAGTAIRPYGEWEYPYRAGATPFGPWGNPQGPWTLPFGAWQNPYALNRLPYGYGPGAPGYGPGGAGPWQTGPQAGPPAPPVSATSAQCRGSPAAGRGDGAARAGALRTGHQCKSSWLISRSATVRSMISLCMIAPLLTRAAPLLPQPIGQTTAIRSRQWRLFVRVRAPVPPCWWQTCAWPGR